MVVVAGVSVVAGAWVVAGVSVVAGAWVVRLSRSPLVDVVQAAAKEESARAQISKKLFLDILVV